MSYDVMFVVDVGGPETVGIGGWSRSPTWNYFKMWDAVGLHLKALNGLRGRHVAEALDPVLSDLKAEPDEWRRYNPPSGRGTYEDGLEFLVDLWERAREWPEATLEVT